MCLTAPRSPSTPSHRKRSSARVTGVLLPRFSNLTIALLLLPCWGDLRLKIMAILLLFQPTLLCSLGEALRAVVLLKDGLASIFKICKEHFVAQYYCCNSHVSVGMQGDPRSVSGWHRHSPCRHAALRSQSDGESICRWHAEGGCSTSCTVQYQATLPQFALSISKACKARGVLMFLFS